MLFDVYRYAGSISPAGYEKVCAHLNKANAGRTALLIMGTPGGDPHAGFRIARALQHAYENSFEALIPRYCKSAGTLVLLGARRIYMADRSELGPLDIQIKKGDELFGRSSGLDINQAVDFLKNEALVAFNDYMHKLVRQGLSTKVAAEISVKLAHGIFNPIAAQIEPLRLAEMQRATAITYSYGRRLADVGKNVRQNGLETLVGGYPSHGFVIDRKEARNIFEQVDSPSQRFEELCYDFQTKFGSKVNDANPTVTFEAIEIDTTSEGTTDDTSQQHNGAATASSAAIQPPVDGDGIKNRSSSRAGKHSPQKGTTRRQSTKPSR